MSAPALALGSLLALGLLVGRSLVPPPPVPASAPRPVFSAERALATLRRLIPDDVPHPVGSPEGARVVERLQSELRARGLRATVRESFTCGRYSNCATVRNVLVRLPGTEDLPAIALVTHHDSRAAAPGAADAGASVAAMLEVADCLRAGPPLRHPLILLFDDGEEDGLHGAEAFASGNAWARNLLAVVNLEARGTSGPSLMFETTPGNLRLIQAVSQLARPVSTSLFSTLYELLPNDTDLSVFRSHDIPGVNLAFLGNPERYHTALDTVEGLDARSLQHHGDNALAMVRALDELGTTARAADSAVHFDLLGRVLIAWPARLTRWIAGGALLLHLVLLGLALRAGRASGRQVAWGLGGVLAVPLLAGLAGWAAESLLASLGALPGRWVAHPAPALAALWLLAVLLAIEVATRLDRRCGPRGSWHATWLAAAGLGMVLALRLPGPSYLLVVPTWVAALLGLFLHSRPGRGEVDPVVLLAPGLVAALLWLPVVLQLPVALGFALPGLHSLAAALVLVPVLPLLVVRARRGPATLAGVVVALLVLAACLPPWTPACPQPLALEYRLDADAGVAHWRALAEGGSLPAGLRDAVGFRHTDQVERRLKGATPVWTAAAPRLALAAPEVVARRVEDGPTTRRVALRLRSRRGASRLGVSLAGASAVQEVRIRGRLVYSRGKRGRSRCFSRVGPGEELELEVTLAPDGTDRVVLWDSSEGLPPEAEPLVAARGPAALPAHDGDLTIVTRTVSLAPER